VKTFRTEFCKSNRKGSFPQKKTKNCSQYFQVLQLQAIITPQWLQIARNSLPNWFSAGCLVFIFTGRINSKSFPWPVRSAQESFIPTQVHGNVQCPLLRIKTNNTPQCGCGMTTDVWKKSRLNWKLKISNAADNADITQSQTRDTRRRQMLEVNSFCTDSRPLRANTVFCHFNFNQHSLLVIFVLA